MTFWTLIFAAFFTLETHGSGCGGRPFYSLKIWEVENKSEAHFQTIAKGPGFVMIRLKNESKKILTLVSTDDLHEEVEIEEGKRSKLIRQNVTYEEYDGCEDYDTIRTGRYVLKIKSRRSSGTATFVWPRLIEYDETYDAPSTWYSKAALPSPF